MSTMYVKSLLLALVISVPAHVVGQECADGSAGESFTHTGYLVDNACWNADSHIAADGANMGTNPQDHTKKCLLMPPCIESGYGLLEELADGSYDYKYALDEDGNAQAVAMIETSDKEDDYKVDVEGLVCGDTVSVSRIALAAEEEPGEENCESFTHTGYIVDNACWNAPDHIAADGAKMDVNPEDHTKKCLLMPPCIESGYSLLEMQADGTYAPKYMLDDESNAMAVKFFEQSTKESGYEVVAEGSACGDTVTISAMSLVSDGDGDAPTPAPTSSACKIKKAGVVSVFIALALATL